MTDNITVSRELLRQVLEPIERATETAMHQTVVARIPESGLFGGIAQDLNWAATELRAALEQPAAVSAEITEKRVAWVAFTNQDLTEGRGNDIPIAVCDIEATARRIAKKRYVQGSDGPVRAIEMIKIGREWYAPSVAYILASPTKEDRVYQDKLDARKSAEEKAKSLGLTDSELSDLGWRP